MNKNLLGVALVLPICISIASINASEINISKTQDNCVKQYGQTIEKIKIVPSLGVVIDDLEKENDAKKEKVKVGEEYSGMLFFIDIDKTVTTRDKYVLFSPKYAREFNGIVNILKTKYSKIVSDYDYYEKIVQEQEYEELTELGWVDYIKYIQEHRGQVIFVTAIKNRKINGEMLADMRAEKLRKLGVKTKSFSDVPPMWLGKEGESQYWSAQGILTSFRLIRDENTGEIKEDFNKGAAVDAFIEKLAFYYPIYDFSTIVMVDDWEGHVFEMSNYIRDSNRLLPQGAKRKFLGYVYDRVYDKPYKFKFSYKRALFQGTKLITEERLYTDAAAEVAMQNEKYALSDDDKKSLNELQKKIKEEQTEKVQKSNK